ncbi:major facilitator superfamily domain-containing protein [Gongronella butleri]|nr:major facilitator superfamily domain-containing protein [Gongronella butleri]
MSSPHDSDVEAATIDQKPIEKLEQAPINPDLPMHWSNRKKYSQFAIVFLNAFLCYFSSAVYIPALTTLKVVFDVDLTTINSTVSLFIVVTGIAPMFWAPLSERIGRKPTYLASTALYAVFSLISGFAVNLPMFYVFRILQGIACSASVGVGGGTVTDIFEPRVRGKAMGIFLLGVIIGPAVGPLVGGYVNQYLGWRWIFYLMAILGAATTIANVLFLKETLYRDPNDPLPSGLARFKFNPFASLKLLGTWELFISAIPQSVIFGWFYLLVTSLPIAFGEIYHFNSGTTGLLFLASGIGNCLGSISSGIISDMVYARLKARNGGVAKAEFRLWPAYIGLPFTLLGMLMYGWFLNARTFPWIAPVVSLAIETFGQMFFMSITSTYAAEAYFPMSASALSAVNFMRTLFAMVFSLVSEQVRNNLGDGLTFTVGSIIFFASTMVCLPILQKYGERFRAARLNKK